MATATHNPALTLQISGAPSLVLKRGEKTSVPAKAGQRYRVVKDSEEGKDTPKEAAKDVAASQQGQDLLLSYTDGTQVVLQNFYEACKAEQCAVDMPGAQGTGASGGYVITGDSPVGSNLSGGGQLVYAFGDISALNALTQGQGQGAGFEQQGGLITYVPSSSGALWTPLNMGLAALGAAVLLQSEEKVAPVPTVIRGSVVAGPVVEGNGLTAVAYKADGSVLASAAVGADGTFTLTVGNDYVGPVLVKVSDANSSPDYWDEATGAPKDLTTDLRALTVIPAAGTYNVSVNVLTELAVRNLGLSGGDTGNSSVNFTSLSSTQITQSNQKVAAAVGLSQDLVLGAAPVAIITTDGSSNTQANDYGRLLAALSGAEEGSDTNAVLNVLTVQLQSTQEQSTGQLLETLLEGAAKVNLVEQISDITNQKSTAITIETVAQDNRLSPSEMIAGVLVQGTAAVGASVSITWSDATGEATDTGLRTVTANAQGIWSTSFDSTQLPSLGATTLKATVGAESATRSIYLDELPSPTIALSQMTGGQGNPTATGDVEVSGLISGAQWDYSLDGGSTWERGNGNGFTVQGDGVKQVLVRQNIGGHFSPSSNVLNFVLDATAPSFLTRSTADAVSENSGAGQLVYTAQASDEGSFRYSLKVNNSNDAALFSINANTGAVTLTGNPDYEAQPSYRFTVIATDAANNSTEQAVTLAINNVDDAAPTITSAASANAAENQAVLYTATATDTADTSAGITWSLSGADAELLNISSAGVVSLKTGNLDQEGKASYSFSVVASDGVTTASSQAVTVTVSDLDEVAPTITSAASANAAENQAVLYTATATDTADTSAGITWSLSGADAELLNISSAGVVSLKTGNLDQEGKGSYSFSVVASDGVTTASSQAVTVTVSDLDEVAPTITSATAASDLNENSGANQVVYTATSTDTGDVESGSTTYSLKANNSDDAALFSINANTGAVTLTGNPDYEAQPSYRFTVIATDAASNSTEQAVTLAINNLDEVAPTIESVVLTSSTGALGGLLNLGDTFSATITFSEAVTVTGTPQLALSIGGDTVQAQYVSGSASTALLFTYTIAAAQTDADGIGLDANSLGLNSGSIQDSSGNDAVLTHVAVIDNGDYRVDTSAPTLTDSSPLDGGVHAPAADLSLSFSEKVQKGSGNIRIVNDTTQSITTIAVSSSEVTVEGKTVTINPAANLSMNTAYHLEIDAGALVDAAGNAFAGISDATALNFTVPDPAISLNAIGTDNLINAAENGSVIALGGTLSSTSSSVVSAFAQGDFTVTLTSGSGSAINATMTGYNTVEGTWSATVAAGTLVDGQTYSVQVSASRSGYSATASGKLSVDTTIATPGLGVAEDTGVSGSDGITANGQINVTGLEAGGSWEYSTNSGGSWTEGAGSSFKLAGGSYATGVVKVRQTDAADNTSELAFSQAAIAVDVTDPVAPTLALVSDSGANGSDGVSLDGRMGVTGLQVGARWQYSTNAGENWSDGSSAGFTLSEGRYASGDVQVRQMDEAGNVSAIAQTLTDVVIDTSAPSLTSRAIAAAINENSGANQVVYTAASTDQGGVSAGSTTYSLKADNSDDAALFSINTNTGAVTLTGNPNYESKSGYSFTVVATDLAGNTDEQAVTLAINDVVEVVPTISITADSTELVADDETTVYFTLSVPSPDFSENSIEVTGGSLSEFTDLGDGEYGAFFTPDADSTTTATIRVASGAFTDEAGNPNADGDDEDNTLEITVNSVRPVIQSLEVNDQGQLVLTYDQDLSDEFPDDFDEYFLIEVDDVTQYVDSLSVNGAVMTVTLNAHLPEGDLRFEYTDPEFGSNGAIRAASNGNDAAGFILGTVADGYIQGAQVYIDTDANGLADVGEIRQGVLTSVKGSFLLPKSAPVGTLIAMGGTDVSTGLEQTTPLKAPAGSRVINPLTTLVQEVIEKAALASPAETLSVQQASDEITAALGLILPDGKNLTNYDPLAAKDSGALATQKAAAQLGALATLVALDESGTGDDVAIADQMYAALALRILDLSTTTVNLTDTTLWTSLNLEAKTVARMGALSSQIEAAPNLTGITDAQKRIADDAAPTIAVSSNKSNLGAGETATFTFTLSEDSTDFVQGDITVAGGSLSNFSGSGKNYTAIFTPTANSTTAASIGLASDKFTDAAGNKNTDGNEYNNTVSMTVNTVVQATVTAIELSAIAAGEGGFVINGQYAGDASGYSVSSAGDVNGDGLADLIVGANGSDPRVGLFGSVVSDAGSSYVVFGTTRGIAIDLSDLSAVSGGIGGFVIDGQSLSDNSGVSVSFAGDVNGDGLADLIVGANLSDPSSRVNAGRSYVVFGKSSTSAVNLNDLISGTSTLGFVINGQAASSESGISVSTAGDMNGDGLADLIVGAHQSSPTDTNGFAGRSYVVYGKTNANAVELASIATGTGGFVIDGLTGFDLSGRIVSAAGDVNGDGLADLMIGAPGANPVYDSANYKAGRIFVLFGQSLGGTKKLSDVAVGLGGFVINGEGSEDALGQIMGAAGDVNGDGLADLIMGVPSFFTSGGLSSGRSYVVFGKSTGDAVNLSAVTSGLGGFIIDGNNESDRSGASVSAAGDMNGDGLGDLIVGATGSNGGSVVDAGRTYVVFGKTDSTGIKLSTIVAGSGGFVINGQCRDDLSGNSVSAAGDVNGDGLADLIVGASASDTLAGSNAGRSYVIFGNTSGAFSETAVDWLGTAAAEAQSDGGIAKTLVAGAGDDALTATAASVLYGGAGNDTFTVNAAMVNALQSRMGMGGNVDRLSRIDGGSGMDSLVLSESGQILNLSSLAATRVQSIEVIDLSVSGANLLQVNTGDVAPLADMNLINSATAGWAAGTYTLAATERMHQLVVQGNTGDVLLLKGAWTSMGTVTSAGVTHEVYTNSATREQLMVQNTVRVVKPAPVELSAVANGQGGFVINGPAAEYDTGTVVASGGDINNDGFTDVLIGDKGVGAGSGDGFYRSYVVFGGTALPSAIQLSNLGSQGFTVRGEGGNSDGFIKPLASPGDVNGDGFADLIVGAAFRDSTATDAGRSYVVFGKSSTTDINLSAVAGGVGGFAINGEGSNSLSGSSVAGADINGDGLADLIVGAPNRDATETDSGRTYVVFGKTSTTAVNLSTLLAGTSTAGFIIDGEGGSSFSGAALATGGDINGDGLTDLIIGGPLRDSPLSDAGRTYVVFGKTSGNVVKLSAVLAGSEGFVINGQSANDESGRSLADLGDINGDGLADFAIGAAVSEPNGASSGRTYVVFGQTSGSAINLSAVAAGSGGFVINGQLNGEQTGFSVAALGDLNADGLADYLVGAPLASANAGGSGRAYVVFGRCGTQAIELSAVALGSGGFVINGQSGSDSAGFSVSAAGDLNGDGFTDLLVGAPGGDPTGATNAGRSYVIWGNNPNVTTSGSLDLRQTHGDATDDSRNDNGQSASFVTGMGNDTLTASVASVLYAGKGNDLIRVSGAMLTGLENDMGSGGNTARLARIDGGEGLDTLALVGGEQHLNFSQIQQSGSWPRIDSIEVIDMVGTGDNVFSPTALGVMGLGGRNIFNSASGWTGLSNTSDKYQVRVEGNAGDWVNLPADWILAGQATWQNTTYNIYNSGKAQMLVNSPVTVRDDLPPSVQSVALTAASGAVGALLNAGDTVTATVTFSEVVKVNTAGGTPTLALDVGGTTVLASYSGGSNSGALTFTATLANGLNDADGIAIGANGLALNGGVITDLTRSVGSLAHAQVGLNAAYTVDTAVAAPNTSAVEGVLVAPTNVEAGATVEYRIATITGGFGSWRSDLAGIQPATNGSADGRYQVQTRQTDVAGNVAVQTLPLDVGRFYAPIELSAIAAGVDGFVINGVKPESGRAYDYGDMSGYSVSSAGDVNGDGLADVIVGAQYADGTDSYQINSGRSYVVFGKSDGRSVNLSQVAAGTGGFVIDGYTQGDKSGISVSGAGDVNGDGLADLIVGAGNRGSFVVFGKTSGSVVQVADIAYRGGTGGLFIEGTGLSIVNAAGDVNGDGLADLIVGAPDQDYLIAGVMGVADAGRSYVVFGKASLGWIRLNTVAAGSGGFVINGIRENDHIGTSVSAAGDVNGDGLADLIVGAPNVRGTPGWVEDNVLYLSDNVGTSYIVFGKTSTDAVDLFEPGLGLLVGHGLNLFSGASVSAAGDVNGDGLADVIVGAWGGTPLNPTRNGAGQSYVVFGQTSNDGWQTNLIAGERFGGSGFVINGESSGDGNDELSVSGAGDINGDGLADLIVGAGASDPTLARTGAGRSYVVYGKTNDNTVELSAVAAGSGGFVINGDAANDTSGVSVSAAGDVNGDGLADLLVGAHKANNFAGKSYVIFGGTNGAFQKSAVDWLGTSGDDTQSDGGQAKTLVGGAGNDVLTATGSSVLYGGTGNDTFNIDANMITALQLPLYSGGNWGQLARIDGGGGMDTIVLSGAGLTLDLTQVANQAASNPDGGSRIDSVEKIDLTGSGNNTLKLSMFDVLDMGSANLFETTGRQQLLVKGNAGDTVDLADGMGTAGWTFAGSNVALDSVDYAVWHHDTSKATVYVQTGVVVS